MIRPATHDDAEALARLAGELGYPTDAEKIRMRIGMLRSIPTGNALLVAERDGAIAGWIHVAITVALETGAFAEIRGLVVTEAWRSRGVGAELVAAGEEWARGRAMSRIRLRTNVKRERAHRFYERCGYEHTKTSRLYEKSLR